MTRISAFLRDEAGAVTVDWVVLTASVTVLGLMIFTVVSPQVNAVTSNIANKVDEASAVLNSDNAGP